MLTGHLPEFGFLLSIAGLSLTLAGFSGLVVAFRREGAWKPIDAYRLRQIPEMGLATTLLALIAAPLSDWTGNANSAIRITAGLGLAFTIVHVLVLLTRMREQRIQQARVNLVAAGVLDLTIIFTAAACLATGSSLAFEWLLILLLARPMLAFALVVGDAAGA